MCRLQCGKMDQVQCPQDRCEWSGKACQPLSDADLANASPEAAAEAAASEASDAAADADAAAEAAEAGAEAAEASSADAAASSADAADAAEGAAASASEADAAAQAAEAAEAAVEDAGATAAASQQQGASQQGAEAATPAAGKPPPGAVPPGAVPPGDVPAEPAAPKPAAVEPDAAAGPTLPPAPRLPPGPSCTGFKAKASCPADRCIWGGWFCQPLATGRKPDGGNFGACEKVKTGAECATTGGDGKCRCTFGVHPLGKKFKRPGSKICSPNPKFGTATDTCTPPGYSSPPSEYDAAAAAAAAAEPAAGTPVAAGAGGTGPGSAAAMTGAECMVYKAKGTCPKASCMWGGWFCQPLATGSLPDGGNFGACEKVRTDKDCATTGGDGKCRCSWGVHALGKKYKRPGAKICSPNPAFLSRSDTCVPPGSPAGTVSPAAAAADAADAAGADSGAGGAANGAGAGAGAPSPPKAGAGAGAGQQGADGAQGAGAGPGAGKPPPPQKEAGAEKGEPGAVPPATSSPTESCSSYKCEPEKWVGFETNKGRVCGECSALVNIQGAAGGTCEGFCASNNLHCVEGWEDMHEAHDLPDDSHKKRRHPFGHDEACGHGDYVRPCSYHYGAAATDAVCTCGCPISGPFSGTGSQQQNGAGAGQQGQQGASAGAGKPPPPGAGGGGAVTAPPGMAPPPAPTPAPWYLHPDSGVTPDPDGADGHHPDDTSPASLPTGPRCATYKDKASCPSDRCMFGGWFCQPLPTGATPDGTNYGACEKVRSEVECATAGGDGACRCTWAPHKLGIQYKRPGGKICAPRAGWKASDDTCVPPAVGAPLTTPPSANEDGGEDPGKTPVPPVPSDPATLRCFMHHEVNCPLDRCSWVANSCCAATDSWCQNTGATTSGCTHYQDEASCPTDSNGGAADRCYWGGTFCQSRGATGYGDPKTACESYPLQQQCPAGRCAWSQTNEACEPSSSYGLADLRVAGESAALAYKSGYTPQDMRDAGFKLGEVADALSGCIECQKAAARHAAAAEAVKDGTRNGAPAEPGDVHDDRGNSESESEHRGEERPSSYFTGSKPKAGSKSTSTSAAAAGRVLSTNHTTSSKPSLNAWQRKQLQRTVGLAATEHATTATWTTVLPYSAPARESLTVAEAIAKGFTAAEERTAGCPLKDMAEGLRVLRKDGLAATEAATVRSPATAARQPATLVVHRTLHRALHRAFTHYSRTHASPLTPHPSPLQVGFNKIEMRAGGYSPEEIGEVLAGARLQDGITVKQAHDLGYTPDEIRAAGFSDPEIAETAAEVREGGTSARASYDLGFRPSELREAGYTQAEVMAVLSALKASTANPNPNPDPRPDPGPDPNPNPNPHPHPNINPHPHPTPGGGPELIRCQRARVVPGRAPPGRLQLAADRRVALRPTGGRWQRHRYDDR